MAFCPPGLVAELFDPVWPLTACHSNLTAGYFCMKSREDAQQTCRCRRGRSNFPQVVHIIFLTQLFDINFATSHEQSMPVETQRSAFLCQYSCWADRSMALKFFDPTLEFWLKGILSFKNLQARSMICAFACRLGSCG